MTLNIKRFIPLKKTVPPNVMTPERVLILGGGFYRTRETWSHNHPLQPRSPAPRVREPHIALQIFRTPLHQLRSFFLVYFYFILHKPLIKQPIKMRKTLNINEIPKFRYNSSYHLYTSLIENPIEHENNPKNQ